MWERRNVGATPTSRLAQGVAIFVKAFMGIPAQQGLCNIIIAMTRRDFVKPAFSLRKKRF
jgi:hypothetical protein